MEHSIKIKGEDVKNLYKIVQWIEEARIEAEWAIKYLKTYDWIREQIEGDKVD